MDSWRGVSIPELPGHGPEPLVLDTSSGELAVAAAGPDATLYACGITPYDATHMGHAATFLAFDLLIRAWRDAGHDVTYVQNVTDVDDPLLERAARDGADWRELADREIDLYRGRHGGPAGAATHPAGRRGRGHAASSTLRGPPRRAGRPVRPGRATSTSRGAATPRSARCPGSTGARCWRCSPSAAAIPAGPVRRTRWTRWSGWRPGRASRPGGPRSARGGPAGTSSARRSRLSTWARRSTSRRAAPT